MGQTGESRFTFSLESRDVVYAGVAEVGVFGGCALLE
jgi:hypothetical protein